MPENENQTEEQKLFEVLLVELVYSLQQNTMAALGKLAHPITGKVEKNLSQAKATIDMLRMLKEKSRNNLSGRETKFLDQVILNVQLNYADEVEKENREKSGKTDKTT